MFVVARRKTSILALRGLLKHDEVIYNRTYEKGVYDETLACGTGCSSVAYILIMNQYISISDSFDILVITKSSETLTISISHSLNKVYLKGPTQYIFSGIIDI